MSSNAKRPLRSLLAVLVLFAGPAAAQTHGAHTQPHSGNSASGASVDELVKQLSNNDPAQRLEAAKSLGASKDGKAIGPLVQALGDPDMRVQAKAVKVLGNMRANEATPVLAQHLFLRTTSAGMKGLILSALGEIGDPRAVQPLIEFLRGELDAATRGTAVFALGDIREPEAIDVLGRIAQTDEEETVRRLAREAIGKIEAHSSVKNRETKDPSAAVLGPRERPQVQPGMGHQH